jgi:glycerate-2-kinase
MIRFDRSTLRGGTGRTFLLDLLEEGLGAIDPKQAVLGHLAIDQDRLRVGEEAVDVANRRIWAIAIGKAAVPMAEAVSESLGDHLTGGIALTRHGYGGSVERFRVYEAGHPVPDGQGQRGAEAIAALCDGVGPGDLVLCLLSGGGSALLAAPPDQVSIGDLASTTGSLLASGASIDEVNVVRRHLSTLQGGRLARRLHPARVATLVLSDVIGDRPESIASGPTVPDPTTLDDAILVLRRRRLWDRVPESVRSHLERGEDAETVKPDHPVFLESRFAIVGNNGTLLDAIEQAGRNAGCRTVRLPEPTVGEAWEAGRALGRRAVELAAAATRRTLVVSGGETTVTVTGGGRGGRNQEFALAAAIEIAETDGVCIAALATDGSDGTTDAAGAIVDGTTVNRIERAGLDPRAALDDNDSHVVLAAAGDVLHTGPTRTNVADAYVALVVPA